MFLGISTPLKKASSSKEGNTNNMKGSRGVIGESSQPGRNNPVLRPTDTAMIANTGTRAHALSGDLSGECSSAWVRLLNKRTFILNHQNNRAMPERLHYSF